MTYAGRIVVWTIGALALAALLIVYLVYRASRWFVTRDNESILERAHRMGVV